MAYTAKNFANDVQRLTTSAVAFKRAVEFAAQNVRDHGNLDPAQRLLDAVKKAGNQAPKIAAQGREYLGEVAGLYYEKAEKAFKYDTARMSAAFHSFDEWKAMKDEARKEARRSKEYDGKEVDAEAAEAMAKAARKARKAEDTQRAQYYERMVVSLGYRLDNKGKVTVPDEAAVKVEQQVESEQQAEAEVVS